MTLGEFIRLKRCEKKITQSHIAKCAKMRQYEMSLLEAHNKPIPKRHKLVTIAQTLGINPDLLILLSGQIPLDIHQSIAASPEQHAVLFLKAFKNMRETYV